MDKIFINELHVDAIIGVLPHEKQMPQPLLFDLEIEINTEKVVQSDQLEDAVNYQTIATRIAELTQKNQFELLEPLAEKIAFSLFNEFPIASLRLRINKPKALTNARAVGIEIFRQRQLNCAH